MGNKVSKVAEEEVRVAKEPEGKQGNEVPKGIKGNIVKGIETGRDVTAQGDINVHISHPTVHNNEQRSQVSSFRIVDAPIDIFEGRQHLLAKIHKKLKECSMQKQYMKRTVALVAMGGMGKTETARKLVDVYREHYQNVAWVDAETESSARQSFIRISEALRISNAKEAEGKKLPELVYQHISQHVKEASLFIFDNTNRLKTDADIFGIFNYLPTQAVEHPPLILLTSQTAEWKRHCAVVDVTEMSRAESLNFFQSRFKRKDEEIQKDNELRKLLETLIERLNGYPLALGLAAANVSFIPGQGSMELLKHKLKKYIGCVDDKKFLEQRVDTQLATDYNRTMSAVWDIAMENLERQESAMEAKHLLSILAHCPQEDLMNCGVERLYKIKNANLGITFPDENGASFEEALNVLQTVGIARVEVGDYNISVIRVHRLVQELARLGDNRKIGIQKMSLQLLEGRYRSSVICLREEYLWSDEGILSWALENDYTVLLWLNALREQLDGGRRKGRSVNDGRWKKQLEKFRDGTDFAVVAEYILNHKTSHPDRWLAPTPPPDKLWSCIVNAVEAKSRLVGDCKETRVFLELMLLLVIEHALHSWCTCNVDEVAIERTALSLLRSHPQPDAMLVSFSKWLSEFDFSSAIRHYSAKDVVQNTLLTLEMFGKCCTLTGIKVQLVSTKAWLQWEEAMRLNERFYAWFWFILLEALDLDQFDEPRVIHRVLSCLPCTLVDDDRESVLALGVLRKLVIKRNHAQLVIANTSVMNGLKLHNPAFTKESHCFYRFRSSDETRRRLPGVPAGVLGGFSSGALNVYNYMIVCIGLCTNPSLATVEARQTLMELLPVEKCKSCTQCLSECDYFGRHIIELKLGHLYGSSYGISPCFTKCDLDEDHWILSRTLDWLLIETEPQCENSWEESLIQLIKTVQKVNRRLLSWMLDTSNCSWILRGTQPGRQRRQGHYWRTGSRTS